MRRNDDDIIIIIIIINENMVKIRHKWLAKDTWEERDNWYVWFTS